MTWHVVAFIIIFIYLFDWCQKIFHEDSGCQHIWWGKTQLNPPQQHWREASVLSRRAGMLTPPALKPHPNSTHLYNSKSIHKTCGRSVQNFNSSTSTGLKSIIMTHDWVIVVDVTQVNVYKSWNFTVQVTLVSNLNSQFIDLKATKKTLNSLYLHLHKMTQRRPKYTAFQSYLAAVFRSFSTSILESVR